MIKTEIKSYRDLVVWQKGYELVKQIYTITAKLPQSEVYALQSQMRRSAVSIISNIAEGTGRKTRKDYCLFMHTAKGSALELETQLFLLRDLYNISVEPQLNLLIEISKMLYAIINKLETRN